MLYNVRILIVFTLLIIMGCETEDPCVKCESLPSLFSFQIHDINTGEKLINNENFESSQLEIINTKDNSYIPYSFIDEGDSRYIQLDSIGRETERINILIKLNNIELFTIEIDIEFIKENCCKSVNFNEIIITNAEFEVSANGIYKIYYNCELIPMQPELLLFELVDQITGENLLDNGYTQEPEISITNTLDKSEVPFSVVTHENSSLIQLDSIGWESEVIQLIVRANNKIVFSLYADVIINKENCFPFTEYKEINIANAEYEKLNNFTFKILVRLPTQEEINKFPRYFPHTTGSSWEYKSEYYSNESQYKLISTGNTISVGSANNVYHELAYEDGSKGPIYFNIVNGNYYRYNFYSTEFLMNWNYGIEGDLTKWTSSNHYLKYKSKGQVGPKTVNGITYDDVIYVQISSYQEDCYFGYCEWINGYFYQYYYALDVGLIELDIYDHVDGNTKITLLSSDIK